MVLRRAILLIAHGSPAKDTPREILVEWRQLHAKPVKSDEERKREQALEQEIRHRPRSPVNDPYGVGSETLASELRAVLEGKAHVLVAYNEFAAPSVDAAVEQLVNDGVNEIDVLSTMITPGGGHSEVDIPAALASCRQRWPNVALNYLWPYDLKLVAQMLARHVESRQRAKNHSPMRIRAPE
jgi:sirohydrochlorin cobaltochelatase